MREGKFFRQVGMGRSRPCAGAKQWQFSHRLRRNEGVGISVGVSPSPRLRKSLSLLSIFHPPQKEGTAFDGNALSMGADRYPCAGNLLGGGRQRGQAFGRDAAQLTQRIMLLGLEHGAHRVLIGVARVFSHPFQ